LDETSGRNVSVFEIFREYIYDYKEILTRLEGWIMRLLVNLNTLPHTPEIISPFPLPHAPVVHTSNLM
jgi:hypothetical protein